MSGIYIPNMEKPKGCSVCPMRHRQGSAWCQYLQKWTPDEEEKERLEGCPLVEVPPHGDLKDYDSLGNTMANKMAKRKNTWHPFYYEGFREALKMLDSAPTIIEASTATGFCNTEGCSNSNLDMSEAQNHICPYYQGVCSLDERIICYCQHHYEMCDKFIEVSKEME